MVWLVITSFLLVGYGLLIRYYYGHFKKLPLFSANDYEPKTFVSVIVAARNEEGTMPHLLNALAVQTYPQSRFEIIIVDDFSTDNTAGVVQTFLKPHIHYIQPAIDPTQSSKKRAIEAGVRAAKAPLLLITDADCIPGRDWIRTVAAFYEQRNAVFIASPVLFTQDNSLLQIFQALDFLTLQGITAASVGAQFHTMCNGANLAYTKSAFEAVNGFEGIDHIASGDDMLLMYKIWQKEKSRVQYLKSKEAIVSTAPMQSWTTFFNQRKRWGSKTIHYNDKRVFAVLLFVYLFNCWFLVLLAASFWNPHAWKIVAGYLVLKTAIEWPFVAMVAKFYNSQHLMPYFFFMQPLHIFYTAVLGLLSQWSSYKWKGRITK
jgi:cellulose synthase/poly-beta-1,6-N-acetylglucosamine synthase-like glycosyltransferase